MDWFTHFIYEKNAKWSNGDPVTAQDFVFSYRRILNPELASQYASMLHESNRVLGCEILSAGRGKMPEGQYHEEGIPWDEAKVGSYCN